MTPRAAPPADLVVVGAGVVGLAHAAEAADRGLSVVVVERDDRPVGASVRNFGHGCVTAQVGRALRLATAARARWLELGTRAGFWVGEVGTVVVARHRDEMDVLCELAAERDGDVRLLGPDEARALAPVAAAGLVGGAHLLPDLRVDPRRAVPALAAWLAGRPGVRVLWRTSLLGVEPGRVATSRGTIESPRAVVCVGHDVDRLFPRIAAEAGVRRCSLHMLRVAAPAGRRFAPAVLTGTSLLRYGGFAACPSAAAVRTRLEAEAPELLAAEVNLMFTQHPSGDLLIGDTHHHDAHGRRLPGRAPRRPAAGRGPPAARSRRPAGEGALAGRLCLGTRGLPGGDAGGRCAGGVGHHRHRHDHRVRAGPRGPRRPR